MSRRKKPPDGQSTVATLEILVSRAFIWIRWCRKRWCRKKMADPGHVVFWSGRYLPIGVLAFRGVSRDSVGYAEVVWVLVPALVCRVVIYGTGHSDVPSASVGATSLCTARLALSWHNSLWSRSGRYMGVRRPSVAHPVLSAASRGDHVRPDQPLSRQEPAGPGMA
uniref:Uncharacterized protein n=1 Tax=Setaria viridis TaxID=4556 RepID=A0A4V6D861_SETVI|nr:hypothetical protein SEVIR_4G111800v2 [Setaria viridis]